MTTIQSCFKPSKFNPPSSLPRTLPFIFSIKLCKIPLRLHVSSPSMIGANRVYQLFMISYSPVNWERREKHWNGNFVLSAVPLQALAQAGHSKVINCAMFAALHWSCRLAACQNQTDQPSACILICLLYFNCWDALSLPPPRSSEVQKLQEPAGEKRPFHKHHTTH